MGESLVSRSCAPPLSPPHWPFAGANAGRKGRPPYFGPNLPAGELLGSPFPWGKRRARESPQTPRVGGCAGVCRVPADRAALASRLRPGSRGPSVLQRALGAPWPPAGGSRDSKSLAQVHFRVVCVVFSLSSELGLKDLGAGCRLV